MGKTIPVKMKWQVMDLLSYMCSVCGWIYDEATGAPEQGIAPQTRYENLPTDFVCPLCGVDKTSFIPAK